MLIAQVVKSYYQSEIDGSYYNLAEGMADILEYNNARFNRGEFLTACEPTK